MTIYTLNKTGQFHKTHTEDHVITLELGNEWIVGAVMDGCSSGRESYFASTLFGKIIQKSVRMLSYSKILSSDPRTGKMGGAFIGSVVLMPFLLIDRFMNYRKQDGDDKYEDSDEDRNQGNPVFRQQGVR